MRFIFLCLILSLLSACSSDHKTNDTKKTQPTQNKHAMAQSAPAKEISWDDLIPEAYAPDVIIDKYQEQLNQYEDGAPEAEAIYKKIMAELNSAPLNEAIKGQRIKLPGFIAPLNFTDDKITTFLLVPYFGACIHVPPPPINQTILVHLSQGQYIDPDDSYQSFYITGIIQLEGKTTEIGNAGYTIADALVEAYIEQE